MNYETSPWHCVRVRLIADPSRAGTVFGDKDEDDGTLSVLFDADDWHIDVAVDLVERLEEQPYTHYVTLGTGDTSEGDLTDKVQNQIHWRGECVDFDGDGQHGRVILKRAGKPSIVFIWREAEAGDSILDDIDVDGGGS